MGKKIKFDDIKTGDVITVEYTVLDVDTEDTSFQGSSGEYRTWVYPVEGTVIRRVGPKKPRLIPDDAQFLLWTYRGIEEVFWKRDDGSWESSGDQYSSTKAMEAAVKALQRNPDGDPDSTLVVLERRES